MAVNPQDIAYLYQNITGRQATDADLAYWGGSQANTDMSTLQHTMAAAAAQNNDVGANTALGQSKVNLYGNPNFVPNPHASSPNVQALTVQQGDRSQSSYTPPVAQTPAPMPNMQQQQQMPSWINDMQSWWQGMQQQQQAPASYTQAAFPQYTPNYGNNALMRPVTQGSGITAQNQYGNMGYNNNRSSLWGDW